MTTALAPWACDPLRSRGRRHAEAPAPTRNEHQRDRDRIVHSSAFRRLVYKTQVFVNHEGDLFRTRLTHSLEAAQLGRSMARTLALNEDLVEAIALAHDLGHTPFGHAGQDALHACMREHGGFEHNLQSLRVVDTLEQRYPAFDGLNLTFETREGILKHCARRHAERLAAREPDGPAARFLRAEQPGLEAQLVNVADAIAYNAHDIDDGVRSGLLSPGQLAAEVPLYDELQAAASQAYPGLGARRLLSEVLRRLITTLVDDLVATTQAALDVARPADVGVVRRLPPLVRFSAPLRRQLDVLQRFLMHALYRHAQVLRTTERARDVVSSLYLQYRDRPAEMAPDFAARPDRERAVADYVAGMTDRFAQREHQRLTGRDAFGA